MRTSRSTIELLDRLSSSSNASTTITDKVLAECLKDIYEDVLAARLRCPWCEWYTMDKVMVCGEADGGYWKCRRPQGHDGFHVACARTEHDVERWEQRPKAGDCSYTFKGTNCQLRRFHSGLHSISWSCDKE